MTSVDEWTKAETGVGAAIAAGSHALNGIWALLVIAPKTKRQDRKTLSIVDGCHPPVKTRYATRTSKNTSPSRFVSAVIIPAPKDFPF